MDGRRERERLRRETAELFSEVGRLRVGPVRRAFRPPADVFRTDDPPAVTVVCDLAGVDPDDVRLAVADGILTIAGVRRRPPAGVMHYQQAELDYGPFERRIDVGAGIDGDRAEATYDRGLLTVRLPLEPQPSRPVTLLITVVRQP